METKYCSKCDTNKPLDEFTRSKKSATNFRASNHAYHSYCKLCNAVLAREWRKNNPGYVGSGVLKKYSKEDREKLSAIRARIADAKGRAKKSGMLDVFNISKEYMLEMFKKQEGRCALTGCELILEQRHHRTLSIDKIKPEFGYIEGNVQWTCWSANRAKGDMSTDMFIDMCKHVLENQKVQRLSKSGES